MDKYLASDSKNESPPSIPSRDKWIETSVFISLPCDGIKHASEADAPKFEVNGLYHRHIVDVILWTSSGLLLLNQLRRNFTSFLSENTGSHLQMNPMSASIPKLSHQTTSRNNTRKSTSHLIQTRQGKAFQS